MPERGGGEVFRPPEREQMEHEPIVRFSRTEKDPESGVDVEKKYVAVAGVELEVYDGPDGSAFSDDEFKDFSFDDASLDLLKRYAVTVKLNQPVLIEGETDIGKTKTLEYLAHLENRHLYRLSLSGATDVTEFIGKYVPNTEDAHATFERILRNRAKLSDASRGLIEKADHELRGLTEDECRVIAKNEGLDFGEKVQWVWKDGVVVNAMRHDNGRGAWLYLDEIGATEPQILVKLNRIFEKYGRLEISENGNRLVEAGDDFRLFASTNPPEYAGRQPFAPDFLRRWTYQKVGGLPLEVVASRLKFLFRQEPTDATPMLKKLGVVESAPLSFVDNPSLSAAVEEFLVEYFSQMRTAVSGGAIGKDQRQKFRYEFTDLIRVRDYLSAFGGGDPAAAFKQAIDFYFSGKLGDDQDREKVSKLFDAVYMAKKTGEKIAAALGPEKEAESPEVVAARQAAEQLMRKVGDVGKKESGDGSPEVFARSAELRTELEDKLTKRFTELGSAEKFVITPPELPEGLTPEHLEAAREALGGGFEERILPTLEDLRNLDEGYVEAMYPKNRRAEDEKRGLISFRSNHWDGVADTEYAVATGESWGGAYLRSMRAELTELGGSLVLLDIAIKPKYKDGKQHYGSVEGTDPKADKLLPLFQEAFGKDANRFNHTWDDLNSKLLPLAKAKMTEALRSRGLKEIDFDVILVPATLDNLEMTLKHLESSSTNTWEWTSTPLLGKDGKPTDRRLIVGGSEGGGAGRVDRNRRSDARDNFGARLAVVFRRRA